jgi:mannose-6-phosphate isomerase
MKMIYKMKNLIQDYAWGSINAIPELLGYGNEENHPQAELWMGSHRRGTSQLITSNGDIPLSEFINQNVSAILGEKISAAYGDLPFLFKVLAAGSPLSIQVHPDKDQAEKGFQKENALSIPLDAYNRNYKDDNHKPEIMCAITDFWAMRGFRTMDSIISNFEEVDLNCFKEEVNTFSRNRTSTGLKVFFSAIMSLEGEKKRIFINELVEHSKALEGDAYEWVLRLYKTYPEDAAIAGPLYLNLVKLKPGQALYLAAGELHAYLDGLGMELMASSDNVLRGGLTPKFIDREELKSILNFSGADPEILTAHPEGEGLSTYSTPSEEFKLSRIDLKGSNEFVLNEGNGVQILFVSEGIVRFLSEKGDELTARKGESVFIPFDAGKWVLTGQAVLFRASVPGEAD